MSDSAECVENGEDEMCRNCCKIKTKNLYNNDSYIGYTVESIQITPGTFLPEYRGYRIEHVTKNDDYYLVVLIRYGIGFREIRKCVQDNIKDNINGNYIWELRTGEMSIQPLSQTSKDRKQTKMSFLGSGKKRSRRRKIPRNTSKKSKSK